MDDLRYESDRDEEACNDRMCSEDCVLKNIDRDVSNSAGVL